MMKRFTFTVLEIRLTIGSSHSLGKLFITGQVRATGTHYSQFPMGRDIVNKLNSKARDLGLECPRKFKIPTLEFPMCYTQERTQACTWGQQHCC